MEGIFEALKQIALVPPCRRDRILVLQAPTEK
jgi:hypothetical protein